MFANYCTNLVLPLVGNTTVRKVVGRIVNGRPQYFMKGKVEQRKPGRDWELKELGNNRGQVKRLL